MHKFTIEIGDYSADGHGLCENFTIESNKSVLTAREAYWKAVDITGISLCGNGSVCSDYGDSSISEEQAASFIKFGYEFKEEKWDKDEPSGYYANAESMLDLVLWFLTVGDKSLKTKVINDSLPTLSHYGYDKKKRHLGQIGYGVFSC